MKYKTPPDISFLYDLYKNYWVEINYNILWWKGAHIMNKILLINRLDPQDYSERKKKIFFTLGGMNIPSVEAKLIRLLNKSGILSVNDILYKYNGVELNISVQQIPTIIKLLANDNISIYSIYEIYNPEF